MSFGVWLFRYLFEWLVLTENLCYVLQMKNYELL